MLKTLLASTALATLMGFAVQAQDTPPETTTTPPPAQMEAPTDAQTAPPVVPEVTPEVTDDTTAPAAPEVTEDTTAPPPDTMAPDTVTGATTPAGALPEGWVPVDLATVTPDLLIGADLRTYDGETIAAVEDVLMSAEGKIDNVVVRFGGFLGFGETQVLLAPDEIAGATDADGNVAVITALTPEAVKERPEYVAPEGADAAG